MICFNEAAAALPRKITDFLKFCPIWSHRFNEAAAALPRKIIYRIDIYNRPSICFNEAAAALPRKMSAQQTAGQMTLNLLQ